MAKEERDPARDRPRAARSVVVAVISLYLGITVVALSALPVVRTPAGTYTTALGPRYQNDPLLGIVSALSLGPLEAIARAYVGVRAVVGGLLLCAVKLGVRRVPGDIRVHRDGLTIFIPSGSMVAAHRLVAALPAAAPGSTGGRIRA